LKQLEEALNAQRAAAAEAMGKVALYQEMLQPMQDLVTGIQLPLDLIASLLSQQQEAGHTQQHTIGQMRQIITELAQKPEFATV
jgi:hypothetical protein